MNRTRLYPECPAVGRKRAGRQGFVPLLGKKPQALAQGADKLSLEILSAAAISPCEMSALHIRLLCAGQEAGSRTAPRQQAGRRAAGASAAPRCPPGCAAPNRGGRPAGEGAAGPCCAAGQKCVPAELADNVQRSADDDGHEAAAGFTLEPRDFFLRGAALHRTA